ncbi:tetratricopeptide repeat protein [Pseudoalteromonas piscicida]|uniref:tetratricopeptide repeat protein n=1 Tax=Pseudoalteromonas piscicida TaxID=43662 RepID=UPI001D09ABFA|nr:tetratricopeptide repeat protein [Pseudoalteromonas piscicida]UDM62541.1 tetratricopeptide repeat protein [Pseudoalteromonas piscicida]
MSYQLPALADEYQFEKLVRDLLRRELDDPSIECFGRRGQTQYGIDGFSPSNSSVTFQCKLKDIKHNNDVKIVNVLKNELEKEVASIGSLPIPPSRFIFASTFKNDAHLQLLAQQLSNEFVKVEYWGWETISEKIWRYATEFIPTYYPYLPIVSISGFRQVTITEIERAKLGGEECQKLALDYYRINDSDELVFKVVCNDIDIRNDTILDLVHKTLQSANQQRSLWLVANGGFGKTSILNRIAIESVSTYPYVFILNLEHRFNNNDEKALLSLLKYTVGHEPCLLCIDNPAANPDVLQSLIRQIPAYNSQVNIVLAERGHRFNSLKQDDTLVHFHGEEELEPIVVRNSYQQRKNVYQKLFSLLALDSEVSNELIPKGLNSNLGYVNATYSILLELKKRRKIDYAFDWSDFDKLTRDIPAYKGAYKYIALFYLYGVKLPVPLLEKVCGADKSQTNWLLERMQGEHNEPIVIQHYRDADLQKRVTLRTKHEIVSEIFFSEFPNLDKTELMLDLLSSTDFSDPFVVQAFVNIFGNKKVYIEQSQHIELGKLAALLLKEPLAQRVKLSSKFYQALHLGLAWSFLASGQEHQALSLLETFLAVNTNSLHVRTELSKIYQRQNKLGDAEAILLDLLKLDSNNLQARTELAKIYQRQNKLGDAEALLKEILNISPKDLNSRVELAKIYQRQNKLGDAEAVLLESLKIDSKQLHPRTELAKIYQRQNKLGDAEALLKEILNISPKDLNSRVELAKIYQRQNKLEDAEVLLKEILKISLKDFNSRVELAKIYQRQNKLEDAEAILLELLKLDSNNLQARTELAKIYQRQNKLGDAEAVLLESLKIDSKQLHPRTELAKIYQRQNKLGDAEAILLDLLKLDSNNLQARTELAKIYQRQNKLGDAEAVLLESLKIDSKQLHPRTELAKIYQRQNKLGDAEAVLLESLKIDSKQLHPRTELAKIYQRQNKLGDAEAVLLESLKIDSKQLHPRTELAKIYQRQNKFEKAEQRLLEYIELDPKGLHPRTELAKIYQRQNKFEKAEQRLLEYIELDPKGLHPRTELAKIYQRQNKFEMAKSISEQALKIEPTNSFAMAELIGALTSQKKPEQVCERFFDFVQQKQYRFGRHSQAAIFRFLLCCQKYDLKKDAQRFYGLYREEMDSKNEQKCYEIVR